MRGVSVIQVGAGAGVKRFRLVGGLDVASVPIVRRALSPMRAFRGDVQLDLSELTFLSSEGAQLFAAIARNLAGRGRVHLIFPSGPVLRMLDLLDIESDAVNLVVVRHPCRQRNAPGGGDAGPTEPCWREEAAAILKSILDGSAHSTNGDRFRDFRGLRELGKVVATLWGQHTGTRPKLARGDLTEDRAIFVLHDALPVEHRQLTLMRRHGRLRDLYERLWRQILPRLGLPGRRLIGRAIRGGTASIQPQGRVSLELYLDPRVF